MLILLLTFIVLYINEYLAKNPICLYKNQSFSTQIVQKVILDYTIEGIEEKGRIDFLSMNFILNHVQHKFKNIHYT